MIVCVGVLVRVGDCDDVLVCEIAFSSLVCVCVLVF